MILSLICLLAITSNVFPMSKRIPMNPDTSGKNTTVNLGGGYKNLKWGMSYEQVSKLIESDIGLPLKADKDYDKITMVAYKLDEYKSIACYFYNDKLIAVLYLPKPCKEQDLTDLVIALETKYGKGVTTASGLTATGFSLETYPLLAKTWNDGVTVIELFYPSLDSLNSIEQGDVYKGILYMGNTYIKYKDARIAEKVFDIMRQNAKNRKDNKDRNELDNRIDKVKKDL